jgi:phosphatidylglycerol:prolipoprotein diacylglycerol transferase
MFPDLFSIGPLTIHTYGLFVALGFTVGLLVMIRLGKTQGLSSQQIMDVGFIIIIWAVIGSRLTYALINFSYYMTHPIDILKIWQGGLVFSGGLIAVVLGMSWYIRRHHLSFWKIGDLCGPAASIGESIGRIGCFMAGCCYGQPTDLKWGILFTHPQSLAPLNVSLHPTQIYHSLTDLIIFVVLMFLHARKKYDGQVFLWFLILHSVARLFIERFRGDNRGMIPGTDMSATQLVTILILIGAVVMLYILKSRKEKESG